MSQQSSLPVNVRVRTVQTTADSQSQSSNQQQLQLQLELQRQLQLQSQLIAQLAILVRGSPIPPIVIPRIVVTPTSATVIVGQPAQFTAILHLANGTTQNITSTATWTSSNILVAYVTAGQATGVSSGTTTIRARQGLLVSNGALLTVV